MFFKKSFNHKDETSAALETKFGKMDNMVIHAVKPFEFGYDSGGRADVYMFNDHIDGIVYITCDLWGKKQKKSDAGNYELMVAHRKDNDWGPSLIAALAYYTMDASLNSGETMSLSPHYSNDTDLSALIFDKYCEIEHKGHTLGVMALIGITEAELEFKRENGGRALIQRLKDEKVYPFTVLNR